MESQESDQRISLIDSPSEENELVKPSDETNSNDSIKHNTTYSKSKLIGGTLCIILAVLSDVALAEALQLIETGYSKPYFLRYVVGSGYSLIIFGWLIIKVINDRALRASATNFDDGRNNRDSDIAQNLSEEQPSVHVAGGQAETNVNVNATRNYDNFKTFRLGKQIVIFLLCGLFLNINSIFGQYFWYLSLESTTVGVNLAIYQTQAVFAYIGSIFFFKSKVSIDKIIGVLLSFAGVFVIASIGNNSNGNNSDDSDTNTNDTSSSNSIIGISECVISTMLFASSEISVKFIGNKIFNPQRLIQDTLLLQFFMGVTALLFFWPFIILFNYTNIENFQLPDNQTEWLSILIPLFLDLTFIASLYASISLLNCVIVGMAQLLTIPASFIADMMIHGYIMTLSQVLGSICIIIGFVLMEVNVCQKIKSAIPRKNS